MYTFYFSQFFDMVNSQWNTRKKSWYALWCL